MEPATFVNVMRWSSGSSTRMLLASSKHAPWQYFFRLPSPPSFPASHQLHQVPFMEFISHASMKFHFWLLCLGLFTTQKQSCHHGITTVFDVADFFLKLKLLRLILLKWWPIWVFPWMHNCKMCSLPRAMFAP